jgi:hypothetical protein
VQLEAVEETTINMLDEYDMVIHLFCLLDEIDDEKSDEDVKILDHLYNE